MSEALARKQGLYVLTTQAEQLTVKPLSERVDYTSVPMHDFFLLCGFTRTF
jgi:hypothetical protein